jgi:predicted O-methyltransferase YrrM
MTGRRFQMATVATRNPWLNIPLDDYAAHMSLPAVGPAQMLADQLDHAIARWAPTSIAVIGCAGGNGLERIAAGTVGRVVAVDVNPDYIERTRVRHAQRLLGLELVCADVQSESVTYSPADLTLRCIAV